jgi:hypothetical protein
LSKKLQCGLNLEDAIAAFELEKTYFFDAYESGALQSGIHPVFGVLNFEE